MAWQHAAASSARPGRYRSLKLLLFVVISSLFALYCVGSAAAATAPPAGYDVVVTLTQNLQGKPGTTVWSIVSWRNAGPDQAPRLRITYTPPLGTEIPGSGLPTGWTKTGRSVTRVTTAVLPPGRQNNASIPLRIPAKAVPGTLLVGGEATGRGLTGQDRAPANNTAYNRVLVLAAVPSPTPSPTPTVTRTPTPTPTKSPAPKPTVRPTVTTAATGAPTARTTQARVNAEPSLSASTYLVAAPSPSSVEVSITPQVIQVTDASPDGSSVELLPLLGALTCFTAAALGGVAFKRRQAAAQAHDAEVRSLHEIY